MDLLGQYGSDSEEDEHQPCKSKKARLPVPAQIQDMFREKDEPEKEDSRKRKQADHQDRIRTFPHARGNWATCLFAELKRPLLDDLAALQSRLHLAAKDETVKIQPELHLSLSRTVAFPLHWIELFLRKITKEIGSKIPNDIPLFWSPDLRVFVNDEKTRTFIGLCVFNDATLKRIVEIIDKEFAELKLPSFYDPPVFHVSLLWTLGDRQEDMAKLLPELNKVVAEAIEDGTLEQDGGYSQTVDRVVCKSGNKTFYVDCNSSPNGSTFHTQKLL